MECTAITIPIMNSLNMDSQEKEYETTAAYTEPSAYTDIDGLGWTVAEYVVDVCSPWLAVDSGAHECVADGE